MLFSSHANETRQYFYGAWSKHKKNQPLIPLETEILRVVFDHPEYHYLFQSSEKERFKSDTFQGQSNPFMHMGLHLAIREQVATDRPLGIKAIYLKLLKKHGDTHPAEHVMMDILAQCLYQAQSNQTHMDEKTFLSLLIRQSSR